LETPQPHINPDDTQPAIESASAVVAVVHRRRSWKRRLLRGVWRTFLGVLMLFLLLTFIIQLPPVQNRLVDYTTNFLTKELKTTVTIERFSLNFFDKIALDNVYIGNQNAPNDTLINVKKLEIDVNYLDLAWGIVQLDATYLTDVTVRMKREEGQYDDNFQFLANYFDPPSPPTDKKKNTPDLRFGQIHLRNVDFTRDDKVQGQRIEARLQGADIHTNIVNLPNRVLDITRTHLYQPFFHIQEYKERLLPPRPLRWTQAEIDSANKNLPPNERYGNTFPKPPKKPFLFQIGAISLENGTFFMDNWDRTPKRILPDSLWDSDHMKVYDINLFVHNFLFTKDEFTGVVDGLNARDGSGFVLSKLTCGDAKVTSTATELYDLRIETPYSAIGDTFIMRYPNYRSFYKYTDEVRMEGHLNGSQVLIDDIMAFAPQLENNPFFRKNRKANARINADFFGTVNKLNILPFEIELGKGFYAAGKFHSRDLEYETAIMNIKFDRLTSSMPALRELIPDFKPPTDFDKLGEIDFEGNFDGFINSFVTLGDLKTSLGNARLNLQFTDSTVATYSGSLDLMNFNVGGFTNNPDIGRVTMKTQIKNGMGLTADKVKLDLIADVESFIFKGYDYRNIHTDGNITKQLFKGKLNSQDPNVDLSFDGTIDFAAATPIYKFKADLRRIDWLKLNLLKEDVVTNAQLDFDLTGKSLNDLLGRINISNLLIDKNRGSFYKLDSLNIVSKLDGTEGGKMGVPNNFSVGKSLTIRSDIMTADINGLFDLEEIPEAFKRVFYKYHPRFAADLGLLPKNTPLSSLGISESFLPNFKPQVFTYNIHVPHSKTWTQLIDTKLDTLRNLTFKGNFDNQRETYNMELYSPELHRYDNYTIHEFATRLSSQNDMVDCTMRVYNFKIGEQDFQDLWFTNQLRADTLEVDLVSDNFSSALTMDTVRLNATIQREDSAFRIGFGRGLGSKLRIFGDYWDLDRDNFIYVGKNRLDIHNFEAYSDDRTALLDSRGLRGLSFLLSNFEVGFLNRFIKDDRFILGGKYRVSGAIEDIFKGSNFGGYLFMDSLMVKGENRGAFVAHFEGQDLNQPITYDLNLGQGNSKITSEGKFYPTATSTFAANSLDAKLSVENYPFKTLQLLITEGASDFKGNIDGSVTLKGALNKLDVNGKARLRNAEVTVDYLKLPLIMKDETIKINNTMFDATGGKIYDRAGNVATVKGGLTHNRFENFGLKVDVDSKNFTFLNTEREDNTLFYGKAVGSGKIEFTGDFDRTNIKIKAKSGKGTKIVFPFAEEQTASENRFVTFRSKKLVDSTQSPPPSVVKDLKGIDMVMDLEITRDADLTLVFDEAQGDNIHGTGTGNIRLTIPRTGSVGMTGDYLVENGEYIFTLKRVIRKKFAIKPGGTIHWDGNPLSAQMNIEAGYKLNAATYNFIQEYTVSDNAAQTDSRRPTPIDLTLKLTGELFKPTINFDLGFPNLQSQNSIKSYLDSKMRLLKQDQNELNRQVFGLVIVGGFLPSSNGLLGGSDLRAGGINTLTETASNLVSSLLTNLLSEYITGVDVQVGYSYYEFSDFTNGNTNSGQQYRARINYNINDRWTVGGGANYTQQSITASNSNGFVGGDVLIDYAITEDRRLKLRISYTRDQVSDGQRNKPAVGIRYRKEFDTFDELLNSLQGKKEANKKTEIEQ
jgi:TamB, inner membrane protein subunit of TAM complex